MNPSPPDPEAAFAALEQSISEALAVAPHRRPHLIGVHSGGAWIASRLHRDLGLVTELGTLSSAFHRDDYGRRGLPSEVKATHLPFEIAGSDIILVDDILFTGRTVRAALNELFDYGRPASVELAVLLDRGGRELPIAARYCGANAPLPAGCDYVLGRADDGRLTLTVDRG